MNKTQFFDTVIINTNFENCRFTNSKLQINAGLLLNVRFLATDLKRIVFDEVLIDEQTLRNISTLPGFNKSDYKIEDVTMEKLDLTASDPIFAITEKDMYGTPEYQLNSVLHYLRNTNKKYYDQTMAIMVQHKMFRISSIKVENLDGSIH